jgi:glutathione S-transferase
MIAVYFWPTGNGKKITIMLEECGLPYNIIPVNINKGDQSTPAYDAINPNMDKQLAKDDYLAGAYSIADIAAWPWVVRYDWQGQDLNDYPNVKRWFEAVGARPAVQTGADVGKDLDDFSQPLSDEDRKRLFNLP